MLEQAPQKMKQVTGEGPKKSALGLKFKYKQNHHINFDSNITPSASAKT